MGLILPVIGMLEGETGWLSCFTLITLRNKIYFWAGRCHPTRVDSVLGTSSGRQEGRRDHPRALYPAAPARSWLPFY